MANWWNFYSGNSHLFRKLVKNKIVLLLAIIISIFLIDYSGLLLHFLEVSYDKFSYPMDVPMHQVLTSIRKNKKLPFEPVNEYKYSYKIQNKEKCLLLNGQFEKVIILYVVKSALSHRDRRDAIRQSWGWENRFSDVTIRRIFMLGVSEDSNAQNEINEENAKNKDLVQADFIDNYYNNTIKTMMGFKWVVKNCPNAQFIAFSDDDMYVSTKNLLKFIRNPFSKKIGFRKRRDLGSTKGDIPQFTTNRTHRNRKILELDPILSAFDGRLYSGYVFNASPLRHKSSKWYISLSEYPFGKYPPYIAAGAYVMSYPALKDMYYTSLFTVHFRFDDVFLGIVARKCGISPLHNENFYYWKKRYSTEEYSDVIASHGYDDPVELKSVWDEQRSLGHA